MKKTFGILFTFCLLLFSCSKSKVNSDRKSDLSNYDFNGKIKSVKSELFNLIVEKDTFRIGEKINSLAFDRNSLLEFNKLGNLTSIKEFLYNGKVINEEIYTYDKNDLLVKRKEIDNYGKGSFYDNDFFYDTKDSLTQWIISNKDFKRIHKIQRDENNRPIKREVIQNDTIFNTYIVKYDQNNNVISENEFKLNDIPLKLLERKFNDQNLKEIEQVIEYKTWDTLSYENRYFYDDNNNLLLEKIIIENDSTYEERRYRYHNNGELKTAVNTPKGNYTYFTIQTEKYNENGNIIERLNEPSDSKPKTIWSYKYKYDSKKNWIEKVNYKDNKPLRIVKRKIEYYE
ncbi:hypothetical protein VDP25_16815 [Winogradskyella sp. ECml5-4]|uniref:hypothetical protein n=1 Tax=Winogradskyella sp. ECml5-4 TaxID=3110975 RepID=UPI002FF22351